VLSGKDPSVSATGDGTHRADKDQNQGITDVVQTYRRTDVPRRLDGQHARHVQPRFLQFKAPTSHRSDRD